jgi:calcineurin-like phosphoesterase
LIVFVGFVAAESFLPKPLIADSMTGITTLLMQRRKERLDVTLIVDQIFESMNMDQIFESMDTFSAGDNDW